MLRLLRLSVGGLMASALMLVTSQYHSRSLYMELERARNAERALQMEWRQLQLEQTEQARHARIDQIARQQLGLEPITPARTLYLNQPGDSR